MNYHNQYARTSFLFQPYIAYFRRAVLVAVTLATMIAGCFILLPPHLDELGRAAASQSVFAANFHYWQHTGYFAGAAEEKPLLHTWSLAVEEQFYLVVPFILWGISRVTILRHRNSLLGILGIGFIVSFAASVYGVSKYPFASFYLLPTRAWELLLGSIIAFLPPLQLFKRLPILAEAVSLFGVLLIAVSVFAYGSETPFPGIFAFPPCIGAAMFIWSNRTIDNSIPTRIGAFLSIRPLVFIGLISYSWYLWHWPLLAFATYLQLGYLSSSARIGLFVAGLACAVVTWKYIETPFRKHNLWKSRRMIFGFSGASLTFIFVFGTLYTYYDGFPNRVSAQVLAAINAESDMSHIYELGANDIQAGNAARIGSAEAGLKPALLVWGDSHAMAALPAIDAILIENGLLGRAATRSSTAPVIGWFGISKYGLQPAIEFNESVLQYIEKHHIPSVFITAKWSYYVRAPDVRGRSFEDALVNTVEQLKHLERDVYIMLDVPLQSVHVPNALSRLGPEAMALRATRPSATNRFDGIDPSIISRLKELGAIIIDPKPAFLDQDGDLYRAYIDETVLYRNATHLTATGAIKVLKPLLERHLNRDLARHQIKSRSGEQDGVDQPATAPESKSEGNEKPKPESDGRPR